MSNIECKCDQCGTRFVLPENIEDKIRAYLLRKGYEIIPMRFMDAFKIHNGWAMPILYKNINVDRIDNKYIDAIHAIATNEYRPPQAVLSDILYDDEAKVKYLKGQLAVFEKWLSETTENDYVNRVQITSKIAQLKEQIAELEKKL